MKLFFVFKKIKRAKRISRLKNMIPPYLKGNYIQELNYKLWVTKGARFEASQRVRIISELSSKTIGFLSAYLIIINLIDVFKISVLNVLPKDSIGFITTMLSVLILVYSQFESSRNFNVLSEKHHQCANQISELYNRLRIAKEFDKYNEIDCKEKEIISITNEYEEILNKYPNHEHIDLDCFKTLKPNYFNLSCSQIVCIKFKRYFLSYFKYHLFIYGPVVVFVLYYIIEKSQ